MQGSGMPSCTDFSIRRERLMWLTKHSTNLTHVRNNGQKEGQRRARRARRARLLFPGLRQRLNGSQMHYQCPWMWVWYLWHLVSLDSYFILEGVTEQISSSLCSVNELWPHMHTFHAGISSLTTHACLVIYIWTDHEHFISLSFWKVTMKYWLYLIARGEQLVPPQINLPSTQIHYWTGYCFCTLLLYIYIYISSPGNCTEI